MTIETLYLLSFSSRPSVFFLQRVSITAMQSAVSLRQLHELHVHLVSTAWLRERCSGHVIFITNNQYHRAQVTINQRLLYSNKTANINVKKQLLFMKTLYRPACV